MDYKEAAEILKAHVALGERCGWANKTNLVDAERLGADAIDKMLFIRKWAESSSLRERESARWMTKERWMQLLKDRDIALGDIDRILIQIRQEGGTEPEDITRLLKMCQGILMNIKEV